LLKDYPHLLYDDEDVGSFVSVTKRQLEHRQLPELDIPTWHDQALLLQQLMDSIPAES